MFNTFEILVNLFTLLFLVVFVLGLIVSIRNKFKLGTFAFILLICSEVIRPIFDYTGLYRELSGTEILFFIAMVPVFIQFIGFIILVAGLYRIWKKDN